jgi:hypothetical protein
VPEQSLPPVRHCDRVSAPSDDRGPGRSRTAPLSGASASRSQWLAILSARGSFGRCRPMPPSHLEKTSSRRPLFRAGSLPAQTQRRIVSADRPVRRAASLIFTSSFAISGVKTFCYINPAVVKVPMDDHVRTYPEGLPTDDMNPNRPGKRWWPLADTIRTVDWRLGRRRLRLS